MGDQGRVSCSAVVVDDEYDTHELPSILDKLVRHSFVSCILTERPA